MEAVDRAVEAGLPDERALALLREIDVHGTDFLLRLDLPPGLTNTGGGDVVRLAGRLGLDPST